MEDRGSIAENALNQSGLAKGFVAKKLGIDRKTLYNKFKRADLEYDFIIDLYKIIKRDASTDFPEIRKFLDQEPAPHYQTALENCKSELETYKEKYLKLMEEYTQLLKEKQNLQSRQTG